MSAMTLPGSLRPPLAGIEPIGPVDASERITSTLVLRRRAPLPPDARFTAAELAIQHGAEPADVDTVTSELRDLGVDVLDVDAASRRVRIAGSAALLSTVFGTSLLRVRRPDQAEHRYREGELSLPAPLVGVVVAVLGLDDRPQAHSHFRTATPQAVTTSYTPPQLGKIYAMPANTDGTGQTIAIIELGGGFVQSDLDHYFGSLGLATPEVTAVGVDGAGNQPVGDPGSADGEVVLDIEVAGGIAPKSSLVVYFAPNTDAGFLDAISTAAHADPTPTAITISWGQSEDDWTAQARSAMDSAFADAAALGVTVTAASGDHGSSDGAGSGVHCDFPASSPHALGCGGTTLDADPSTGTISSETVWNGGPGGGATGGGVSDVYDVPSWQANAGVPAPAGGGGTGRGVPDVSADADPSTGYQVYVDGQSLVFGGTSAVAPLWAALVARLAQALGRSLGMPQPALYAGVRAGEPAPAFRDITSGDNGAYSAGPGWDACTGLGSPDGTALLDLLAQPSTD
jgi:kumamolisin